MPSHTSIAIVLSTFIAGVAHGDFKTWEPLPGNVFWSVAGNWSPTGAPQTGDVVAIVGPRIVFLDEDTASLSEMLLQGGASLSTDGHTLSVLSTSCSESTMYGVGTILVVDPAPGYALEADHMELYGDATLEMAGGLAYFTENLDLDDATLRGRGGLSTDGWILSNGLIQAIGGELAIDAGTLDLDGPEDQGAIHVANAATLAVDGVMNDPLDGPITLGNGSTFSSTQPWTFTGEFGNDLTIDAGSGEATIDGGSFFNDGNLIVESGRLRAASEAFVNDLGGAIDLEGTTLLVDGQFINSGELSLVAGIALLPSFENNGLIHGAGLIEAEDIVNNGTIETNGALAFILEQSPDLDGANESGALDVTDGDLTFVTPAPTAHGFDGSITLGSGRTLDTGLLGLFINDAQINSFGGTIRTRTFRLADLDATYNVEESSQLITTAGASLKGVLQLNSDLTIRGPVEIYPDAIMQGDGTLVIAPDGTLDAWADAHVPARTRIEGTMDIGIDAARSIAFDQFLVLADGSETDLDLTADGQDHIAVDGPMYLGGTLRVERHPGFEIVKGEWFVFAQGSARLGEWSAHDLPPGIDVEYGGMSVRLYGRPECPGDVVCDGYVDVDDLVLLLTTWGDSGSEEPADVDEDGVVGANDLVMLLANWGVCD